MRVRIPAGPAEEFSSPELTLCADSIRCPFHPRATAVARKRPWSLCQKCRWQVTPKHARTIDPTKSQRADYAAVKAWCRNLPGNELTRNLSGNIQSQSSQLAEPRWTDPVIKSGISVRDLISTLKKNKSAARTDWSNILPKYSPASKMPAPADRSLGAERKLHQTSQYI